MPPARTEQEIFEERLRNYKLFLEWLKFNEERILGWAYSQFQEDTGLSI